MSKIIAIVDCNNFYVSCERVFAPVLAHQPLVVLSNNDGCIIARSEEAKQVGIKMAEPVHMAKFRLQKHGVVMRSANFALYGDMSRRVMEILEQFAPEVEIYSIDEAFLDLEGFQQQDLTAYGQTIRNTVQRWTGIPVSVGIAPTKTLAKVAAQFAKKSHKAHGVLDLRDPDWQRLALARLPVGAVWGVGRKQKVKLEEQGITTALQLRDMTDDQIMQKFNSITMLRTVWELRGISCIAIEPDISVRKGVLCSRSFGNPVNTLPELQQAVAHFTARAAERMRTQKLAVKHIQVFIRTNRFSTTEKYSSNAVNVALTVPSDSTHQLIRAASQGLESIFEAGRYYAKAGVFFSDLYASNQVQQRLFETPQDREKLGRLMTTVDGLNRHWGSGIVHYAAEGMAHQKQPSQWQRKHERRSQRYTTNLQELMEVL